MIFFFYLNKQLILSSHCYAKRFMKKVIMSLRDMADAGRGSKKSYVSKFVNVKTQSSLILKMQCNPQQCTVMSLLCDLEGFYTLCSSSCIQWANLVRAEQWKKKQQQQLWRLTATTNFSTRHSVRKMQQRKTKQPKLFWSFHILLTCQSLPACMRDKCQERLNVMRGIIIL